MWQVLLANKWTRLIGVCVLCFSVGLFKGCSDGYERGKNEVQGQFDAYKQQIALDLQVGKDLLLEEVQRRAEAQNKLALLQGERRDIVLKEIEDVQAKLEGFRFKLDDNCRPTDNELRATREALDKARASSRKN